MYSFFHPQTCYYSQQNPNMTPLTFHKMVLNKQFSLKQYLFHFILPIHSSFHLFISRTSDFPTVSHLMDKPLAKPETFISFHLIILSFHSLITGALIFPENLP